MIVVSDATPVNHLCRAGLIFVLPEMLGKVIVPSTVYAELNSPETPAAVKAAINPLPEWLEVKQARLVIDAELDPLDPGERQAIILAEELKADLLLMDDKKGREIAAERELRVIGTLGLLERAALRGLTDFPAALKKLKDTGFYVSGDLEADFLSRFGG